MPAARMVTSGYSQLDDKGRLQIPKDVRTSLGIGAGSTVAYVGVGDMVVLIPQDAHLARLAEAAMQVFERVGITVDDLLEGLDQAREEVVTEHYGADFLDELERRAAAQGATPAER